MTIAANYGGATESGRRILRYAGAGASPATGCKASYGTSSGGKQDSRALLGGVHGLFGYLYYAGQGATYKTNGDRVFAQNLGLGGSGNDGVAGHYADALSSGSAPGYAAVAYQGKEFAMVGGASGAQPYLAWRIGGAAAISTNSLSIGFS